MNIDIKEKKDNKLLSRQEIKAHVTFSGSTPPREELKKEFSKITKAKPELVIIKNIYTNFGAQEADILLHVYTDQEILKKIEQIKEEKKEEKKEEAPAEE